ncbi:hypothetical protein BT93_B1430 [Corymbia citriodora subsp. variegata]|nr:hypothetical protein BT93_B1430 [Corymbia citriodora subsp. variegata]KAF8038876.1 hypothetical protein BT93_B1430 [Corymbia citriodora subsp. variegata]KAF8038877.1 hypothetical protein BT93_B1430 [Corymbia citriodora subsp. variegata]
MDRGQSQGKRKRVEEESTKGASTSSLISPVAITQGDNQYDVFLSFRGSDTRKNFTDHLYHRLVNAGTMPCFVFKDDSSIPIGEEFGSQILGAISRSKISIPIISKNYATSKWCLRELIHMMDCKNSMSHTVLPIFYKVKPSYVRHLKGNFGNAFRSQKHFEEKDIREGRHALDAVSYLNGWESKKFANGHEGKLIERVVKTVIRKLQVGFQLIVPKQLAGLDGRMKEIMNWIDNPSTNARMIGICGMEIMNLIGNPSTYARMIGIYGMGGIGKTTLAKCIYNQLLNKFEHVSFLPDVQETTRCHGITYLQSLLLLDILNEKTKVSRIDYGINIIKSRFRQIKVLVLLDDIDNKNQLDALARERNWFMEGSLIIVTTRNKAVLDQSEFEVDYKYELNGLDLEQALLLFNRHAFRTDQSPNDFEGISRDIISTMGGLPLTLEVVGAYLYGKMNRDVWEEVLEELKNQPHEDVQKTLRISYDGLREGHKQIFLDIACFFIGKHSTLPMYMWKDCGLSPSQGVEELKLRCLIKIDDYGLFRMHDQLRDLGRSIFCEKHQLEKGSRPWDYGYKGASKLLRVELGLGDRASWFCDLMRASRTSKDDKLVSELRYLQWRVMGSDLSLPIIDLPLPNLSVLELWGSGFTEDWEGWSLFAVRLARKRHPLSDLRVFVFCLADQTPLTAYSPFRVRHQSGLKFSTFVFVGI